MISYMCYFRENFLFLILEYFMYIRLEFFSISENFLDFFNLDLISILEKYFQILVSKWKGPAHTSISCSVLRTHKYLGNTKD
jgi:hypothetical protein